MFPEGTRRKRVAMLLRQEISRILERRLRDPRLGLVTITEVEISADLKHARVFVSSHGDEEDSAKKVEILSHAAAFIRGELGRSVEMRYIPELRFIADASVERADRVNKILSELGREKREGSQ
jgi:ribosome-binding factor A